MKWMLVLIPLTCLVLGCNKKGRTLSESEATQLLDGLYADDAATHRRAAEALAQPGVKMPPDYNYGPRLIGFVGMRESEVVVNAKPPALDDQYAIVYVARAARDLPGRRPEDVQFTARRLAEALASGLLDGEPAQLACMDVEDAIAVMGGTNMDQNTRNGLTNALEGRPTLAGRPLPTSAATQSRIAEIRKKVASPPLTQPARPESAGQG